VADPGHGTVIIDSGVRPHKRCYFDTQGRGTASPVLLVIADLQTQRCSFICLNDYIDKILVPRFSDYRTARSRTLHVPLRNELDSQAGSIGLRWYAKRPKLFAAFQRFRYQFNELRYTEGPKQLIEMARYFAQRIVRYDFWDELEMCPILTYYGKHIREFHTKGTLRLDGFADKVPLELQILELWRLLSITPNTYEDVWREWFLPTALGHATSAPPS